MSTNILFIFEGKNPESQIAANLQKFFVNEKTIVMCAYCTTIYKMYAEISADEDLDTFNLLKEIDGNRTILEGYNRADFAEIYMFFDYDGHASNAGDEKLNDLLNFFDQETDKGKLYISYPMAEALKHIEDFDTFKDLTAICGKEYKKTARKKCIDNLKNIASYDLDIWKKLISAHLKKMNNIVHHSYEFPKAIVDQLTIFSKQIEKYISVDKTVAVLSAFPVFLHDYYGNKEMKKRID